MGYPLPRQYTAVLLFLVFPLAVLCCEGECITGVTEVFVGNYSDPVQSVLTKIVGHSRTEISSRMLPNQIYPPQRTPLDYLAPILTGYHDKAPATLQNAIFAGYFHGKCQRNVYAANGTLIGYADPPGCPNPDCPVVCGTPGSMVHHYPILEQIALKSIVELLEALVKPGSETYKQVEDNVLGAVQKRRYFAGDTKNKEELQLVLGGIGKDMEKECEKSCSYGRRR
ncbi:hypothetical protein F5887DRAFT_879773 [Amanita rubescens]|nr:hypothetical protein F5887DRAFT_879773 [Amanita rubescens]